MKMSVTRALTELKTLDRRIVKAINSSMAAAVVIGKDGAKQYGGEQKALSDIQSSIDSPVGLIEQRDNIKAAVVKSNASTKVTIGGTEMTVAEAIEKKSSIQYKKSLVSRLKNQINDANFKYEDAWARCADKADQNAQSLLGSDMDNKQESYKEFINTYMDNNGPKILKPTKVYELVSNMEEEVDSFESEVDYVLSEANATTFIEV